MGDPFAFIVRRVEPHDHLDPYGYGIRTAKAYITVLLGGATFDEFTIDLSQRRHVDGPIDHLEPDPVIEHEFLEDLPRIPVVPVENHTADKVCAMYGPTGSRLLGPRATAISQTSCASFVTSRSTL